MNENSWKMKIVSEMNGSGFTKVEIEFNERILYESDVSEKMVRIFRMLN